MRLFFAKTLNEIDLEFARFVAGDNEVQYIVTWMAFTKDEILLIFRKNNNGDWKFIHNSNAPERLLVLEKEIGAVITANEAA